MMRKCYKAFQRIHKDLAPTPWDDLSRDMQVSWTWLLHDMVQTKRALRLAKETIGHLVLSNPDILPILDFDDLPEEGEEGDTSFSPK